MSSVRFSVSLGPHSFPPSHAPMKEAFRYTKSYCALIPNSAICRPLLHFSPSRRLAPRSRLMSAPGRSARFLARRHYEASASRATVWHFRRPVGWPDSGPISVSLLAYDSSSLFNIHVTHSPQYAYTFSPCNLDYRALLHRGPLDPPRIGKATAGTPTVQGSNLPHVCQSARCTFRVPIQILLTQRAW